MDLKWCLFIIQGLNKASNFNPPVWALPPSLKGRGLPAIAISAVAAPVTAAAISASAAISARGATATATVAAEIAAPTLTAPLTLVLTLSCKCFSADVAERCLHRVRLRAASRLVVIYVAVAMPLHPWLPGWDWLTETAARPAIAAPASTTWATPVDARRPPSAIEQSIGRALNRRL